MRFYTVLALALVLVIAATAYGTEKKAAQMREDFGTQPLYDCYMNYYYYIPCTTSSWFWMYTNWAPGDKVGVFYTIGDPSMGRAGSGCPPYLNCDPCNAHVLEQFRVLDFAGYGMQREKPVETGIGDLDDGQLLADVVVRGRQIGDRTEQR